MSRWILNSCLKFTFHYLYPWLSKINKILSHTFLNNSLKLATIATTGCRHRIKRPLIRHYTCLSILSSSTPLQWLCLMSNGWLVLLLHGCHSNEPKVKNDMKAVCKDKLVTETLKNLKEAAGRRWLVQVAHKMTFSGWISSPHRINQKQNALFFSVTEFFIILDSGFLLCHRSMVYGKFFSP